MRYRNTIIALGFAILLASTPIIGVPRSWKEILIIAATFSIVVLAYLAGKERKPVQTVPKPEDTSAEAQ